MFKLPATWLEKWKHLDPIQQVFRLQGEIFREQPGRKTLRVVEDQEAYFIKLHTGASRREIFKNLVQGRLPVVSAKNELRALSRFAKFGFVPEIAGYGFRKPLSFIMTKELSYTINLEDFYREFSPLPLKLKWALIRKAAYISKVIHHHGVNHRDFYLCHFLLDITGGHKLLDPRHLTLYVIDWHRAQVRKKVPLRWRIKDIAGLYFSAMEMGLTKRDLWRFMKVYHQGKKKSFWRQVEKRAKALYRKISRKRLTEVKHSKGEHWHVDELKP